ncbi:hypothetical protein HDU91_003367, partial [Kappamyces sp. JEL0680]
MATLHQQALDMRSRFQDLLSRSLEYSSGKSDGFSRYTTAIKSEIKHLEKLISGSRRAPKGVMEGTNWHHLHSIFEVLALNGGGEVYRLFKAAGDQEPVRIDVCCGSVWVKIKARSKYRQLPEFEESENDDDSDGSACSLALPEPKLIKHAKRIKRAALENPRHFQVPRVVFLFSRLGPGELDPDWERELQGLGVDICYGLGDPAQLRSILSVDPIASTPILNLDIPTLISMVSCITHDFERICMAAFDSALPLRIQYQDELKTPQLPLLESMLNNKVLVTTMAAFEKFKPIIETIGGPMERQRALRLFDTTGCTAPDLTVVHPQPVLGIDVSDCLDGRTLPNWKVWVIPNVASPHMASLGLGIMSENNLDVFGTGHELHITTVTANGKIARSIEKAGGREYSILVHEPRGLIEQKWKHYT